MGDASSTGKERLTVTLMSTKLFFPIQNRILDALPELTSCMKERLMTLHLPLSHMRDATIIRTYSLNPDSNEDVKEKFDSDLEKDFTAIQKEDHPSGKF